MYLCVLGRQPELSAAELMAIFGHDNVKVYNDIAIVSADEIVESTFNRLGGTIKLAEIISHDWNDITKSLPEIGKVTLGLSAYNTDISPQALNKVAIAIKKARGSVRIVPNKSTKLSSATVYHNRLTGRENKFEFILAETDGTHILARTLYVQDIKSYSARDYSRPKRDAKVGMLPPKLAQIMINLAVGDTPGRNNLTPSKSGEPAIIPVVLDPFCGTGVVLQEAALMGYNVYGTDIEEKMIDYTKINLKWLSSTHKVHFFEKLEVADATDYDWQPVMNFVVCETYLGKAYNVEPPLEILQNNVKNCNTIIKKFLLNISSQIEDGTKLCIAVPVWFVKGKVYHLALIKQLNKMGFIQEHFGEKSLLYHRSNQIVGRELLVLAKTSEIIEEKSSPKKNSKTKKTTPKKAPKNRPAPKAQFIDSLIDI